MVSEDRRNYQTVKNYEAVFHQQERSVPFSLYSTGEEYAHIYYSKGKNSALQLLPS